MRPIEFPSVDIGANVALLHIFPYYRPIQRSQTKSVIRSWLFHYTSRLSLEGARRHVDTNALGIFWEDW